MNTFKEFQGKDLDSAIEEACRYFNVNRNQLEVEIVRDAKTGIFGIVGTRKAEIRARRVHFDAHSQVTSSLRMGEDRPEASQRETEADEKKPIAKSKSVQDEPASAPAQEVSEEPVAQAASKQKPNPEKISSSEQGSGPKEARKEHARSKREKKREHVHKGGARPEQTPSFAEPMWDAPSEEEFSPTIVPRSKSRPRFSKKDRFAQSRSSGKRHANVTDFQSRRPVDAGRGDAHKSSARSKTRFFPGKSFVHDDDCPSADFLDYASKDLFTGLLDVGWSDDTRPLVEAKCAPKNEGLLSANQDAEAEMQAALLPGKAATNFDFDDIPYDFADMPEEIPEGLPLISQEQISSPEFRETLATILHSIIEPIIGIQVDLQFEIYQSSVRVHIDSGDHSGLLIGREGQTLLAIQYLTSRILTHTLGKAVRLQLDAGEYRQRQEKKLHAIAVALADRARQTGKTFSTRPLSSYHRRIIHLSLQDAQDIQTRSIGDGSMKRVIIMCKRDKDGEKADVNL